MQLIFSIFFTIQNTRLLRSGSDWLISVGTVGIRVDGDYSFGWQLKFGLLTLHGGFFFAIIGQNNQIVVILLITSMKLYARFKQKIMTICIILFSEATSNSIMYSQSTIIFA